MKGRLLAWILVPVLALALLVQGVRTRHRVEASMTVHLIEMASFQMATRGRVSRTALRAHIRRLKTILPFAPADYSIPMALGSQYLLLQEGSEAAIWYRRAIDIEPRPELYRNLGLALRQAGDAESAATNEELVRRLDPTFAERF